MINFYFNICFGFSAFVFKNLWGSNLLKNSLVAFMSGSLIPLVFFPKLIADLLHLLPFSSLVYTPVMIVIGKYSIAQICQALALQAFLAFSDGIGFPADLEKGPITFDDTRRIG